MGLPSTEKSWTVLLKNFHFFTTFFLALSVSLAVTRAVVVSVSVAVVVSLLAPTIVVCGPTNVEDVSVIDLYSMLPVCV